ncbi:MULTISPECIES: alpha-E domain-containing protein [Paraburkholderia]|uniref:Alpha-E superfamily protein n=1 Tax=Paraburkholderia silvatlantica TaxID=321895 RepID=A0A2U1ADC0_9BURK|nr:MULTISPECIES: alpha-E domain-containing protein [Paraburkholderia]MBB2926008.1 putative alpha-E superfamily protein [Paraburkholderia silvatlantica]PVY33541.1 putative alpha-E superfamily protein [Paraburkholderia silvatlantica]PXW38481.1 putative alpha-E superfamily protein [Paraburkholderia silvatlantica]PYE27711.1 putative alpha-E superfamily protein [Paraburkholderia silvatlantica]TDQ92933.1 putative alpha-E superfamily protein [Paraburkholderia silvatlantica]
MLSRTADHLFWMARYMERAENTARMLDINLKALLLPGSADAEARTHRAMLRISELEPAFDARHEETTSSNVLKFLVADPTNPSSIYSCLQATRENARAVRGTLTTEWWETINDTWLQFVELLRGSDLEARPDALFEWVKFRSHLSRGVRLGTALQDDALFFTQLGTFLERADNTARILDVRFVDVENADSRSAARQLEDFYYWTSILGSVSALEIYRKVYRDVVTPARVVELLILNQQMPRSLLASLDGVCTNLAMLRTDSSREVERTAGKLRAELLYADLRQIFSMGVHTFLTQFLARVYELGNQVARTYLMLPVG